MKFHEFVGEVQNRARLDSEGEALKATRATLQVMGQRLFGGEPGDLAAQLPEELQPYLTDTDGSEDFGIRKFYDRASQQEGEGVDYPQAVFHARAVMSVLQDAVSGGEMQDVRAQWPDEYDELFKFPFETGGQ